MTTVIVRGQLQSEIVGIRQTFDKLGNPCETFYQFKLVGREDTKLPTWRSHTELQKLNPYVVLGMPAVESTTEAAADPNATDELPVVIVPEESKSPFSTDWDISTRLFLQIIINPSLNLPADIMALVLEARDRLRETEQAMANARIYSVADQADEIAALKAQLTAVTAERDTLAAAVAKTRSKLNDLLPSDEVQS